jgi:hypothetical protein
MPGKSLTTRRRMRERCQEAKQSVDRSPTVNRPKEKNIGDGKYRRYGIVVAQLLSASHA